MNEKLIIENVRCFTHPKPITLSPLTFLIGENSTGKSTFLSMCRIGWDIAFNAILPDFNEEPFFLGAFDQIVNFRGGRGGKAKSFRIGWETEVDTSELPKSSLFSEKMTCVRYIAKFEQNGSQPAITERSVEFGSTSVIAKFGIDGHVKSVHVNSVDFSYELQDEELAVLGNVRLRITSFDWEYLFHIIRISGIRKNNGSKKTNKPKGYQEVVEAIYFIAVFGRRNSDLRPYASAPVRTKPERTYNPIDSLPKPEGSHVPMVLAKTFFESDEKWAQMKKVLDDFGQRSGLFNSLEVRSLGRKEGDPFQVNVKILGPAFNLIDVGYGVSQALPLVVEALQGTKGRTFLFQQPEVHLHPKGQAELATFLAKFTKEHKKRFVVETHSDYMIDRLRMDIRDEKIDPKGTIDCKDVTILFFDRKGKEVVIHEIKVDESGELVNVPPNFRSFFLSEERRFLGF